MQLPKLNASIGLGNPAKKYKSKLTGTKGGGGTVLKMLDLVSILLFIAIILSYLYQSSTLIFWQRDALTVALSEKKFCWYMFYVKVIFCHPRYVQYEMQIKDT